MHSPLLQFAQPFLLVLLHFFAAFIFLLIRRLFDNSSLRIFAISTNIAFFILSLGLLLFDSSALILGQILICFFVPSREFKSIVSSLFFMFALLQIGLLSNSIYFAATASIASTMIVALIIFLETDALDKPGTKAGFIWNRLGDLFLALGLICLEKTANHAAASLMMAFFLVRCSALVGAQSAFNMLSATPHYLTTIYFFAFSQATLRIFLLTDPNILTINPFFPYVFAASVVLALISMAYVLGSNNLVGAFLSLYSGIVTLFLIYGFRTQTAQAYRTAYVLIPLLIYFAQRLPQKDIEGLWRNAFTRGFFVAFPLEMAATILRFVAAQFVRNVLLPIFFFFFIVLPGIINNLLRFSFRFLHNGNAQRIIALFLIGLCVILIQFLGDS